MIVLPFHPLQDKLEEQRLGKDSYGSTQRASPRSTATST